MVRKNRFKDTQTIITNEFFKTISITSERQNWMMEREYGWKQDEGYYQTIEYSEPQKQNMMRAALS